jgi:hypothetical protein
MVGRAAGLVVGMCLLLPAACGTTTSPPDAGTSSDGPASSAPAWPVATDPWGPAESGWRAGATGADLTPTGIELVSASGVDAMVVDGAGAVWAAGGWQLSRVDPTSGAARTWDVSDDAAFATVSAIRPSRGAGVWLVEHDHLRLFDGQRFVRDLPVPAAYRGGDHGSVNDVAEVGAEVWISSAAGVARSTRAGTWSMVGQGSLQQAGELAVDAAGRVWALGRVTAGSGSRHVLVRLEGGRWSTLGGIAAPRFAEEIVADPAGGVLIRLGPAVRRFDGAQWQSLPALPAAPVPRAVTGTALAMGSDDAVWVAGIDGLYRYAAPIGWKRVAPPEQRALIGLGIRGSDVVVADASGVLLLDDGRLRRFWSARTPGPGVPVDGVLAVSADEVWATDGDGILQFHDGRWERRRSGLGWQGGPGTQRDAGARLALAADGAVWAISDGGLARFDGAEATLSPRPHPDGWLQPGPGSGVWAVEAIWSGWTTWYAGDDPDGTAVTLVQPDGTELAVRLPGPAWSLTSLAGGTDGTLWATICQHESFDYCTVPALMRWDGRWSHVPYPAAGITAVSAAPDGGLWALLSNGASVDAAPALTRYAAGTWTTFPEIPVLQGVAATPQGGICGIDSAHAALVCVEATGQVSTRQVGVSGQLSIAPDGSAWIAQQGSVARLPGSVARRP